MSREGRGGTQVRFSDQMDWLCSRPQPREDMETIPFVGEVTGVTPAVCWDEREVRRRDVGRQVYGSKTPQMASADTTIFGLLDVDRGGAVNSFATSHGNIRLQNPGAQKLGFLPTADATLFLRHQYQGSRARSPPHRYYSR